MGKHGLACDNLLSVDLVTADGKLVTASDSQHADLFWALRGGGGNFGVATSFTFQLHQVGPTVLGGMVIGGLPWSRRMVRSGSYYGATSTGGPSDDDLAQGQALGRRTARYARWLKLGRGDEIDEVEGGLFSQPTGHE